MARIPAAGGEPLLSDMKYGQKIAQTKLWAEQNVSYNFLKRMAKRASMCIRKNSTVNASPALVPLPAPADGRTRKKRLTSATYIAMPEDGDLATHRQLFFSALHKVAHFFTHLLCFHSH